MSGERTTLAAGGGGLLSGSRSRSYGSLVRSSRSSARLRRIEHKLRPGETLQGLALKYGVSMEQIKRANGLYTNDSIFLKTSLLIPVLSDSHGCSHVVDLAGDDGTTDCASAQNGHTGSFPEQDDAKDKTPDLTPEDFLKRLDDLISQSKQAAVRGCQEAEKRVAALEAVCSSRTSDCRPLTRSQSDVSHVAVPLTITRLTHNLRDQEDEIFEL